MSNLTLEQVAAIAGVSRSTVSRVINGQDGVRRDVRERVWSVISETGYRPNAAARALASSRSGIIGVVIPRPVPTLFADPYFPRLVEGITQAANANDLTLALFLFHTAEEEKKIHARLLTAGFLDGVIVASSHTDDPLLPHLLAYEMPLVVIGRQDRYPQASFVDVDNFNGAYSAASHLLRLGYRRIAHISGPQDMVAGVDRLAGYRQALADKGRDLETGLVTEGDFTEAGGYAAMRQLLSRRPDAVFVASDTMAFGAWRAIREAELSVPGDVAVVGFDDLLPPGNTRPRMTTVRQPVNRSGSEAVNVLQDIMANGLNPPRRVILDTELVIRESCGAVPA